jgi:Xaa-Pro aminopeptidase
MITPFSRRRRALQLQLSKRRLNSLVVTHPTNWYYLTGFTGEAGLLIVSQRGSALITDGRFTTQAREETSGIRIIPQEKSLLLTAAKFVKGHGGSRVGFDACRLTVQQLRMLRKEAGARVRWIAASDEVESLRALKDPAELAQMRKAAVLAGQALDSVLKLLRPGVREIEIAAEIEYRMRRLGASGPAFETIVAFGHRSAYPHARPTAKRLNKNELVVLDLGAILAHYCSDITRTVFFGRVPARLRGWYKAVQEAQAAAVSAVKAGVRCGDVDAAARGVLARCKLDRFFVHSTGHGLGLEVHEDPRIARGQQRTLVPGNVITVEPGVYVPGVGGIRIEDDVAVHANDTEILTRVPRDLIEI